MSSVLITEQYLQDIADAIRAKNGTSDLYKVSEMADAIADLPTGGNVNLQSKTNITPTESSQTIVPDANYDGLSSVQINAIPSQYIVPSGTKTITENGDNIDVTQYADVSVNVTTLNKQVYFGSDSVAATSYTATSVSLTVAVTGTYTVSWVGWRNTSSGTSGSQLYRTRNGTATAVGSASTSFTSTYGQVVKLTNQSFQAGDVLTVYARARSTSYYMYVANLVIEQTA